MKKRSTQRLREIIAVAAIGGYCMWWIFWLLRGKLPPAPILALTGLPAPTTGLTRSLTHLFRGDLTASLRWNLFGIPIILLYASSIIIILVQLFRRSKLRLPAYFLPAWLVVLTLAWLAKLLTGPAYW